MNKYLKNIKNYRILTPCILCRHFSSSCAPVTLDTCEDSEGNSIHFEDVHTAIFYDDEVKSLVVEVSNE